MAIKQIITYNSSNRYFAGFLNYIINEVAIIGNVTQDNGKIILLIDDSDQKKLELFSNLTTKYLPYSIFLGEIETLTVNEQVVKKPFDSPAYNIALCSRCLEELANPSSPRYLDDTLQCTHYSNDKQVDSYDNRYYSPHYTPNTTLLLCDALKADELFLLTPDEKKVLFSIEKPTIKVTIKDEQLQKLTNKKFINIKSPFNIKSSLAAINAKDSKLDYLFFDDTQSTKAVVVQKNITLIKDTKVTDKLEIFDATNKDINRFLNIANSIGCRKKAIGANLSQQNGISFIVANEVGVAKAITVQNYSLNKLLQDMGNDPHKSKLLENFSKKYQNIMDILTSNQEYNLFETLSVILELDEKSFEALSDTSLEFRGNGGLKIDMQFTQDGFDYISLVGSVMSFKLAGTDAHYLAYSIFEAFGDFAITTLNQLKTKFKIDTFIMLGDMFENTVLYSRILSKFSMQKPYFSKSFALDD